MDLGVLRLLHDPFLDIVVPDVSVNMLVFGSNFAVNSFNVPLMLLLGESWRLIFVGEDLFKVVRDAGLDALEIGNSHGPEVLAGVFVVVFAGPDAW